MADPDLRSQWELPYVCAFCRIFSEVLKLPVFTVEDLERHLYGQDESFDFFDDLINKLLKGSVRSKPQDLGLELSKVFAKHYISGEHIDMLEALGFMGLDAAGRIRILQELCDLRLAVDDVKDNLQGVAGDNIRYEPVGEDKDGNRYWWFDDTRLYCEQAQDTAVVEEPQKKGGKRSSKSSAKSSRSGTPNTQHRSNWVLVCHTAEQWNDLINRFKKSRNPDEKDLYNTMKDLVPDIVNAIEARDKADRKRAIYAAMPRRQSGRIAMNKQVEEQKRLEEEEQQRQAAFLAGLRSTRIGKGHIPSRSERYENRELTYDVNEDDDLRSLSVDDDDSARDDSVEASETAEQEEEIIDVTDGSSELSSTAAPRPPIRITLVLKKPTPATTKHDPVTVERPVTIEQSTPSVVPANHEPIQQQPGASTVTADQPFSATEEDSIAKPNSETHISLDVATPSNISPTHVPLTDHSMSNAVDSLPYAVPQDSHVGSTALNGQSLL